MNPPSSPTSSATGWRSPSVMLMVMAFAANIGFATWWTLSKNFAVEGIGMTGGEIGLQESIREIPGFLGFAVVYILFVIREQALALATLALLVFGVAITGYFPTTFGFYATTFVMSLGFHFFEAMHQSLSLQWLPKSEAPRLLGRIVAVAGFAQLIAFGLIALAWKTLDLHFSTVFLIAGLAGGAVVVFLIVAYPRFPSHTVQRREIVLRRRYWLYYALTFMGGARRQIFTVFAALMMVQKFGFEVHNIAALFLINCVFNMAFAPWVGALIGRFGERRALTFEYVGLVLVFTTYAFVENPWLASVLYVVDHAFFAFAIAIKTYFQKIADPADIAPTAGVSSTINHIAAVFIPATFGLIWLVSPAAVFLIGTAMAATSLTLARLVPDHPEEGREIIWQERAERRLAAAE